MSVTLWQIAAEPDAKNRNHEDTNSNTSISGVGFSGSFLISTDTTTSSSFFSETAVSVFIVYMRLGPLLRILLRRLGAAFLNGFRFVVLIRLMLVFPLRVTVGRNITSDVSSVSADDVLRNMFALCMMRVVCLTRVPAGFQDCHSGFERCSGPF